MPKPIRALDDLTIARIAAGEVIERPASVVKEMIENAIDAGASEITVEIREGGRRLIRVRDDGHGIPSAEVELAFRKHATSKIDSAEDLASISTLGFRGEALASIASVSILTCLTRAEGEEAGTRLRIDNGRVVDHAPAGAPPGTSISVENLFNALPARLKFLKTDRTEAGHVHDIVTRYALAHPGLRLVYLRDGQERFRSSGSGKVEDVLAAMLGHELAGEMLPVEGRREADEEVPQIRVRGFAGRPHVHRASRSHITLLVNGRWVQDSQLSWAIIQAYHSLMPKGRYPVAVIQIELPPEAMDVNVHPAKTEVRFRHPRPLFATVQRAVRAAVTERGGVAPADLSEPPGDRRGAAWRPRERRRPRFDPSRGIGRTGGSKPDETGAEAVATGSGRLPGYERPEPGSRPSSSGPAHARTDRRASEADDLPDLESSGAGAEGHRVAESGSRDYGAGGPAAEQPDWSQAGGDRLPLLRLIGQLAQTYLLAEGPDGLYLIDQHAAHERVMYEAFMARHSNLPSQSLLSAETVGLPPRQIGLIEEQAEAFRGLGFEIEPFGEDSALVRALPQDLATSSDVAATVRAILDATEAGDAPIEVAFEARLVRAVCKRATVKAGQTLSPAEQQRLVQDLEACQSPWTCPHGRPTVVVLSAAQVERLFGRR